MKFELKRTATLSLLTLTLGAALAGCAAPAPTTPPATDAGTSASSAPATAPESSASASTAPADDSEGKTAAGAKKTTDAFLAQVTEDMKTFVAATVAKTGSGKQLSDAEFMTMFKETSTGTASYLKPGSFDDKQLKNLFTQFGSVYYESKGVGDVAIDTDESDFVLSGDTAVIKGESFKPSIDGEPVDVSGVHSGDLTLEYVDGTWLVSEHTSAAK